MGWGGVSWGPVHALLDEHGGEKEARHQALWDELCERLQKATKEIISDPKYAELMPEIY